MAQPGPPGKVIDEVIAVVGKNLILKSDIDNEAVQLLSQGIEITDQIKCNILEQVLFQKLLVHQAELDSVEVTDEQVNAELEQRMRYYIAQAGSEQKLEEFMGKPIMQLKADFKEDLRQVLLAKTMQGKITADVKATPSDVRNYFNSIPPDSLPLISSELEICQITAHPPIDPEQKKMVKEKLAKLRERIIAGEDFAALAVLYSEDGSAAQGGELGFKSREELVPEFSAAGFSLKGKDVSPVVETQFGFHIIQLIERRGEMANMRHILMVPKTTSSSLTRCITYLDSVRNVIMNEKLNFTSVTAKFSDDKETRYNSGALINPQTGTTRFETGEIDANLFFVVDKLKPGEMSSPVKYMGNDGKMGYRIVYLKNRTEPHKANLRDDYQRLLNITQARKQQKVLETWINKKKATTYIRLDDNLKNCNFRYDWFDKNTAVKK